MWSLRIVPTTQNKSLSLSLSLVMAFSLLPPAPSPLKGFKCSRLIMSSFAFEGMVYKRHLEAAVQVVERACLLCNSVRSSMNNMDNEQVKKSDLSPVTIADFGVQSLVSMELGLLFPSIPLIAEEDAHLLRLEMEEREGKMTDQPALVDMVVEAVTKVASSAVQPVNSNSVLKAIDKGGEMSLSENSSTFWVLDPIDGTHGFLKGGDSLYVIGLSLVVEGNVVLGVMGCPCLTYVNMATSLSGKRMIWAIDKLMNGRMVQSWRSAGVLLAAYKGFGSWLRSINLEVLQKNKDLINQNFVQSLVDGNMVLRDAHFGLSQNEKWTSTPLASLVDLMAAQDEDFTHHFCCGSLCKYLAVAIGAVSATLLPQNKKNVKVWDHAAGLICVKEAGGKVTDGEGVDIESLLSKGHRTFVPGGNSILVTNGHLHHVLLRHLTKQQQR